MNKYWLVNLGQYYNEQREGGFLWAPLVNKAGRKESHWESLQNVKKGDIVFCNKKGFIVSIGIVLKPAYSFKIPNEFNNTWEEYGRKIDVKYIDLEEPFRFNEYKDYIKENIDANKNPFTVAGNAKMGYLFPLDSKIAEYFLNIIKDKNVDNAIKNSNEEVNFEKKEKIEEAEQFEKINNGSVTGYTEEELRVLENIDYHYEPKIEKKEKEKREKTDSKLKATRIEKANFLCEINSEHKTFLNSTGKHQFLECHHIIPMKSQKNYPNKKLDGLFNLVALCPNCHAQVHYASDKEKREIFDKMYEIRKNEMTEKGFSVKDINDVFNEYY